MRQLFSIVLLIAAPFVAAGFLLAGSRGLAGGLIVALALQATAWAFTRPILMRVCVARPVGAGEQPQLAATVSRLAEVAGVATPTIAISALPIPNALAAVTPGGGLICVTDGLIGMLSPAELDAVLAHEIAHLTQPGRSAATLAALFAAIPGAITAAAGADLYFELPYRRARVRLWGGRRLHRVRDTIALVTAPLAAVLVRLSTTTSGELAADERAARITGDPAALASALHKLQSLAGRIVWPVNPAIAHLLVIHPFGCPRLARLFNTHPPTPERLAALRAAFDTEEYRSRFPDIGWMVTAGNSSQITDGASALLLMSEERAAALGRRPRARILASSVVGDDPTLMLTGPIPATRKVLARAGITADDVDAFEVNEAFASVPLAWQREIGVPDDRLNPCGGAIALGHPLGASGARLMTTLINHLEATGGRLGLQTMCEAGGMANATLIEIVR